jgi:hypothetical protein
MRPLDQLTSTISRTTGSASGRLLVAKMYASPSIFSMVNRIGTETDSRLAPISS